MIRNLLFDLGGVIMDIRRQDCVEAFKALGMDDPDQWLGEYGQKGPFLALEKGEIDTREFHRQVKPLFAPGVTESEIDEAFCRFLTGIPASRLEALRSLRSRYGIYLLSNTNPIMFHSRIAREFRKLPGMDMAGYFDGMVASFEAKCYKPDPEIFAYTASHLGIDPAQTLFFDDSMANVEAARRCGYQAAHVPPGTEFTQVLADIEKNL